MQFFGTIKTITITANKYNIQTYACDIESLVSGELYNNCIFHFPYGMQSYPFIGQRVYVEIISNNNYICTPTSAQVYNGLSTKDVVVGRLTDNITIKFTQEDIIIGIAETTKNVIINAKNVSINSINTNIDSENAIINASNVTISADKITLDAPEVECSGQLTAQFIIGITDVMAGGISGKTHTHTSTAPGTPTSPPNP
jgi:phage baseplate assembly protein gpV